MASGTRLSSFSRAVASPSPAMAIIFKHAVLGAVVGVFGASLALGYPQVFMLLGDGESACSATSSADASSFCRMLRPRCTMNDLLTRTSFCIHGINQQIVADGDLHGMSFRWSIK